MDCGEYELCLEGTECWVSLMESTTWGRFAGNWRPPSSSHGSSSTSVYGKVREESFECKIVF